MIKILLLQDLRNNGGTRQAMKLVETNFQIIFQEQIQEQITPAKKIKLLNFRKAANI